MDRYAEEVLDDQTHQALQSSVMMRLSEQSRRLDIVRRT